MSTDEIWEYEVNDAANLNPYVDAQEPALTWEYHPSFSNSAEKAISQAAAVDDAAVLRQPCLKSDDYGYSSTESDLTG